MFKMTFFERTQELKPPLETCKRACREVKDSGGMKILLGTLVALGNYCNGGTRRGQADGFKMEFLPKFKDTKDLSNKRTLLEYAVEVALEKKPEVLRLPDEMRFVKFASRVALDDLTRDVSKLQNDTKNAHMQLKSILGGVDAKTDDDDEYAETMTEFLGEADKVVANIAKVLSEATASFKDLVEYFGYPATNKVKSEELFPIIRDLVEDFKTLAPLVFKGDEAAAKEHSKAKGKLGETIGGGAAGEDVMQSMIDTIRMGVTANRDKLK